MAKIIDGKAISAEIRGEIKAETQAFIEKYGVVPGLAVIIVGSDPASQVYVRNKRRACEEVGFYSEAYELPEETSQEELNALVDKLNADDSINGILCQLPVPKHISDKAVIERISPKKDVDVFSAENVGKMWQGDYDMASCTPMGVIELLDYYNIDVCGKNCVIIGRSNIVGKPMASLLLERSATVTICHSRTQNLSEITSKADVIVAAVGRAKFVTADMVKEGAVVVDVGINRGEDGKLCGDVDFENVKDKCEFITPVPGGCGPMTIAVLMKNTLLACKKQNGLI